MSTLPRGSFALMIFVALCIPGTAQQSADQMPAGTSVDGQPSDVDPDLHQMVASALQHFQRRIMYGATVTEGYVSSRDTSTVSEPGGIRTTSSWLRETFTAFRPYVAFDSYKGKTRLTLQSAPVITYVPSRVATLGVNGFLEPRVDFALSLSPRLWLNLSGAVSYGDALSQVFVLLPQASANSVVSSTSANSASHALSSAEFAASGEVGLEWQRSRRQALSLTDNKVYSTVPGESASNMPASNVNIARGQIAEQVTPSISLVGYSQAHQIRSGVYSCTIVGGGLGFKQQYGRLTTWTLEAGPEYGNSGCNTRLDLGFTGAFQRTVTQQTAISLSATRTVDTFYAPGNNWVTSVEAGVHQRISGSTSFDLTGGYLHGSRSYNRLAEYSGFFVTPRVLWRITDNSSLTAVYGHVSNTRKSGSTLDQDWVTLGLLWHPKPKNF